MDPGDYAQDHLAFIIVLLLELYASIFINVFIIFVIFRDFNTTKSLGGSYKILLGLAISNVCFAIMMLFGMCDFAFGFGIFTTTISMYIYLYMMLLTVSLCTWLTSSLACFYFIKILNFKSRFFSWVKKNIGSIVPWMLLVDLLASLFNSLLSSFLFVFSQTPSHNTTHNPPSLVSALSQSGTLFINTAIVNTVVPYAIIFITTLSTIVTLKKHENRMRNIQTSESEHLRTYEKVVCRMTQSLLLYGIFYVVMIIFYYVVITKMESGFWLLLLALNSFTPLQSILLVLANSRLRATWKDIFLCRHLQEIITSKTTVSELSDGQ